MRLRWRGRSWSGGRGGGDGGRVGDAVCGDVAGDFEIEDKDEGKRWVGLGEEE